MVGCQQLPTFKSVRTASVPWISRGLVVNRGLRDRLVLWVVVSKSVGNEWLTSLLLSDLVFGLLKENALGLSPTKIYDLSSRALVRHATLPKRGALHTQNRSQKLTNRRPVHSLSWFLGHFYSTLVKFSFLKQ